MACILGNHDCADMARAIENLGIARGRGFFELN